jgi:uncharacterized membrane protein YeiH
VALADPLDRVRPTGRALDAVDVAATFLFAVEGAMAGIAVGNVDLLGVLVVGFSTALIGGILRDTLLGDLPPAAFRTPSRILVALAGGIVAIAAWRIVNGIPDVVLLTLDAACLSLFAVTGAAKALEHRMSWIVVIVLGTITGVGGGVVRDLLLNRVPLVLSADVYASAAVGGIGVMLLARLARVPLVPALWIGFVACLSLRLLAVAYGWSLALPR